MATSMTPEEIKMRESLVKTSTKRLIDMGKDLGLDVTKFEGALVDDRLSKEEREHLLELVFKAKKEKKAKEISPRKQTPKKEEGGQQQNVDLIKFMQEMAKMQMEAQIKLQAEITLTLQKDKVEREAKEKQDKQDRQDRLEAREAKEKQDKQDRQDRLEAKEAKEKQDKQDRQDRLEAREAKEKQDKLDREAKEKDREAKEKQDKLDREDREKQYKQDRQDRLEAREAKEKQDKIDREAKETQDKLYREATETQYKLDREAKETKDKLDREAKETQDKLDREAKETQDKLDRETKETQDKLDRETKEEQDKTDRETREAKEKEKERAFDVRLHKAQKIMSGVLTYMPTKPEDMPAYFNLSERFFDENHIDQDLRITLINKYLTDEARKLYASQPSGFFSNFNELRNEILKVYKLSPGFYRDMFKNAEKKSEETYAQFSNRLGILLNYYLESRKIGTSFDKLRKLLISDKLKLTLPQNMRNQARLAEKGKWLDASVLAETLDNYVSDIADMNYSKAEGGKNYPPKKFQNFGNFSFANRNSQASNTCPTNETQKLGSPKGETKNFFTPNKNFVPENQTKPQTRDNRAAQSFREREVRGTCVHCKQTQPTHSPQNCWKNPEGPNFRAPYKKTNIRRVAIQCDHAQAAVPEIGKSMNSVTNESVGFEQEEKCLNSSEFDIRYLFEEELSNVQCTSKEDVKSVLKIGTKLNLDIPESCKISIDVGETTQEVILDTGSDITVMNPNNIKFREGVDCEYVGKISLESAFGESILADLAIVSAKISHENFVYPKVAIQVAMTRFLNGPTLLSLSDFRLLSEQTLVAIPGEQLGGELIRAKDTGEIREWVKLTNSEPTGGIAGLKGVQSIHEQKVWRAGLMWPQGVGKESSLRTRLEEPLSLSHYIYNHKLPMIDMEGGHESRLTCTPSNYHIGKKKMVNRPPHDSIIRCDSEVLGNPNNTDRSEMSNLRATETSHLDTPAQLIIDIRNDQEETERSEFKKDKGADLPTLPHFGVFSVASGSDCSDTFLPLGFSLKQREDDSLRELFNDTEVVGSPYILKNGILFKKLEHNYGEKCSVQCLVLPLECRVPVMKTAHELGHFGSRKTYKRLKNLFFWPGIKKDVDFFCKSCGECQGQRRITVLDRVPIQAVIRPDCAFDTISIDCAGPIDPPSGRGHNYILVAIDHCTRWAEAIPLKTLSAKETCAALNIIFQRTGVPRVVISDNGTNFVSNLNKIFFSTFGVEMRNSTPLHPQGNSLAERLVQNIKKMLHHEIISSKPRDWDLRLPNLLWALRTMVNETTGFSPHELVYGRVGRGPLEILRDTWAGVNLDYEKLNKTAREYLENLKVDLKFSLDAASANSDKNQQAYVDKYNLRSKSKSFEIGDVVLVLLADSSNKLKSSWQGPGTISDKISENSYTIKMPDGSIRHLHANFLRDFKARIQGVGVIFQDEEEKFGEVQCCETGIDVGVSIDTGLTLEKLNSIDLAHLKDIQKIELKSLIWKYRKIFDDKPGVCRNDIHTINLEPGFKPRYQRPYRIPERLKPEVDKQIDELIKDGKIRPSNSPYAHPMVLVYKPDRSVRICIDYRSVNSGTIPDKYPMPRSDDILNRMAPAKFITTVDCTSGYYQIKMQEESIPLTSFITHRGQFDFLVMPFGLKCSGNSYQRAMDRILAPHTKYAAAYIDDVSTFSMTWHEHLDHLENVFKSIYHNGITLKLKKCKFALPSVQFLGHVVGGGTISVVQDKVEAIKRLPEPKTKKMLRGFLGMCSYYRTFIPNFSKVAAPLTDLTKGGKSGVICFTGDERQAFESLKELLCHSTTLMVADYDLPFRIQCDASEYAVGACVTQIDGEGRERPLAFASSKLTETQQRWSVLEREAYAVVYALKSFDHMVFGCRIEIYTDHDPLQYLINNSPKCMKLTRWALHLSRYDLKVFHKAGVSNSNADCLSRMI